MTSSTASAGLKGCKSSQFSLGDGDGDGDGARGVTLEVRGTLGGIARLGFPKIKDKLKSAEGQMTKMMIKKKYF